MSEDHIAKHGVTWGEVEDTVLGRPLWITAGRNETTYVFGTTRTGRYLLVVVVDEGDGVAFMVTARAMTTPEKRLFRQKGH